MADRVARVQESLANGSVLSAIVRKYEAEICDMNAQDQLYEQGVNNLGVSIADYKPYTPHTIAIKQVKGQPTNRVTLRDEGDFHRSFYLDINNQGFEIKASDDKTDDLKRKYGRQILGLTDENKAQLAHEYIKPELLEKMHKEL